ncbi:hypothetical protein BC936DRAFT_138218 [Jimgerdemannia flammicorona]|uniref:Uncharacterized protein n=1 Tax=Jimgerdemannia flammicorona TaxID=994334 RepID=A0A433DIP7_9FUNG|nr:hypothetical protein BC936DRAFT_138218 [Jimgerdemannia flammicorona]
MMTFMLKPLHLFDGVFNTAMVVCVFLCRKDARHMCILVCPIYTLEDKETSNSISENEVQLHAFPTMPHSAAKAQARRMELGHRRWVGFSASEPVEGIKVCFALMTPVQEHAINAPK